MGKGRRKSSPRAEASAPAVPAAAPSDSAGSFSGPWRKWVIRFAAFVGALLALAWGSLCLRAAQHYGAGRAAEAAGRIPEAVREYETAVGCCAPLNPYCGAAARRMSELGRLAAASDPALSGEIRDRMTRALRSARWLFQPHAGLLSAAGSPGSPPPPRDPRGSLFLLSCLALFVGLGAWWVSRPLRFRAALGGAGLAVWGLLLYLC